MTSFTESQTYKRDISTQQYLKCMLGTGSVHNLFLARYYKPCAERKGGLMSGKNRSVLIYG